MCRCGTQIPLWIHQKIMMLPISKQHFGLLSINTSRENNCIPSAFKKQSLSKVGQLCEQSQSKRQQFLNKPVLIRSWIFKQLQKSLKTKFKETRKIKKISLLGQGVAQRQGVCLKMLLVPWAEGHKNKYIKLTHIPEGDLDPSRAEFRSSECSPRLDYYSNSLRCA